MTRTKREPARASVAQYEAACRKRGVTPETIVAVGPKRQGEAKPRRGVQNKWEAAFRAEWLATHPEVQAGAWLEFEPLTFRIYAGGRGERPAAYTPDFVLAIQAATAAHRIMAFDVKGHRTRDSIVRIKACARLYPWVSFALATGGPGRWEVSWL